MTEPYEPWEWASSDEQFLVIPNVRVSFIEHQRLRQRLEWAAKYVPNVELFEDPTRVVKLEFKMAEETLKYAHNPQAVLEHAIGHVREQLWCWFKGLKPGK